MAPELPKPPRRCSPRVFYTHYLPELWSALTRELSWHEDQPEVSVLCIVDEDPQGNSEHYALSFAQGALTVTEQGCPEPMLTFRCPREDWNFGIGDLLPRVLRRLTKQQKKINAQLSALTPRTPSWTVEQIRSKAGSIEICFTDDAGDSATFLCLVGDGQGPKARIAASDEDLWKLIEGNGGISSWLKSRIRIEGDAQYVFTLLRLFEP